MKLYYKKNKYIDFNAVGWEYTFAIICLIAVFICFLYASTSDYYVLYGGM